MWMPGRLPKKRRDKLEIPKLPPKYRWVLRKKQWAECALVTVKRRKFGPFYEVVCFEGMYGGPAALDKYQRYIHAASKTAWHHYNGASNSVYAIKSSWGEV